MKVRELIRLLLDDGWFFVRQYGSHRVFQHPVKKSIVVVAGKPGAEMAPGTLSAIRRQAGLKK